MIDEEAFCPAKLDVSVIPTWESVEEAFLVCDLEKGHPGLHHDSTDHVHWISETDYDNG